MRSAYIVSATRTAGGRKNGRLREWHPVDLSGLTIDALLSRIDLDPAAVEDVIWGCTGQVGEQSSNIARWAALSSRLPESVPGVTVDRQCGSSQQSLHFAAQAILAGTQDVVIAGGVENMTRLPMGIGGILGMEHGYGKPAGKRVMARYPNRPAGGQFGGAELVAQKYNISREDMDRYALRSHQLARAATEAGKFKNEILPVEGLASDGSTSLHDKDEGIRFDATYESISAVRLLKEGGRISAANSSQICDGASGVIVASEKAIKDHGLTPLARIHGMTALGHDPITVVEGPLPATAHALKKLGMTIDDIDLFEVNEAFASVPLAWLSATGADPAKLNVHGGAIALGHPLGATGTKLMTTLIYALADRGKRFGLQAVCEGGGMANVTIIERL